MTLRKHEYTIISSMAQTKEKVDTLVLRNICMRKISVTVMVSIPKVPFWKLLDITYVKSSFSKIITHIDNGIRKIPYNWIFYGHGSTYLQSLSWVNILNQKWAKMSGNYHLHNIQTSCLKNIAPKYFTYYCFYFSFK